MNDRFGFALRLFLAVFAVAALASTGARTATEDASPAAAFSRLIHEENYEKANFYLKNGFVTGDDVDTGQLFFDVAMEKYAKDMRANAPRVNTLYTYLDALKKIDLNRPMTCGYNRQSRCLFLNNLLTGADRDTVTYFVDRGLDLNLRVAGFAPATVPLLLRLGTVYNLDDLNYFVSKGMVLGDELYPIEELASYVDDENYHRQLNMPAEAFSLGEQNLLDVMIIVLATQMNYQTPLESAHRKTLCDFIAYAAPSFTPSFDYLRYLLKNVKEFRGTNIGKLEQQGRQFYQPFPADCVTLMRNMAASHGDLQAVITNFVSEGDVDTANWLMTINKASN